MRSRGRFAVMALWISLIGCGADAPTVDAAEPVLSGEAAESPPPSPTVRAAPRPSFFPTAPRPDGARVPRFASVRDYRRSGDRPYWKSGDTIRWTPAEIVQVLKEDPDYVVDMGIWTGRPTGHPDHREVGRVVNETQALARVVGVSTSRLGFGTRFDVFVKHSSTGGRCGDHCGWEGTNVDDPFDPSWILTVPLSEQQWAIDHRWGRDRSVDPWASYTKKHWPSFIDRVGMSAANTSTHVAALYGASRGLGPSLSRGDPYFEVAAVVMDLRNADYRAWSVRRAIANLQVMGLDPGESAVLVYAYKPGWHSYYGGTQTLRQDCFVPGSRMWIGPSGPCSRRIQPASGPFNRTSYGPGEFEAAVSQSIRDLRNGLVAAGYPDVLIGTVERPKFDQMWRTLDADLRRAPWIIGEAGSACYRRDVARSGPCPLP